MADAIIDERIPKTQEKGNEMARAREPKSETWYKPFSKNKGKEIINKRSI